MDRILLFATYFFVLNSILPISVRSNVVNCPEVAKIDCANGYKSEGNETVCCSDLQVYQNFCFFAQQKCLDPDLTVLHLGHCVDPPQNAPGASVTTPSNTSVIPPTPDPTNIVSTVFCDNKDLIDCRDDLDPVCGTDNTFYQNNCEFAKARCENEKLGIQDLSICKTALRFNRNFHFV